MSLTVGQLVATVDLDDSGMVRGLAVAEAGMHHLGAEAVTTGELIHRGLEEAVSELPEVVVDANTAHADREIADIRARLEAMSHQEIGVDLDAEQAVREAEALRGRLEALGAAHPEVTVQAQVQHAVDALNATLAAAGAVAAADPTVTVDANTGQATAGLAHVAAQAAAVGSMDPTVHVHTDTSQISFLARALSGLGGLFTSVGSAGVSALTSVAGAAGAVGAAVPLVAGLIGTLESIVPAAAAGATAVLALAGAVGAVKLGTSGIGGALKAAFAPAVSGGGGAAKAANQVADAQRNLARATSNAAYANRQAAQGVAAAERDLTAAQHAAVAAQQAVNDARHQAVRDLQDMNNSLVDARYAEEDAKNAVEDAAAALAQARLFGNPEEIERAQLAYDEAAQKLKEQQLTVSRLSTDTEAANKAGVEGSKGVTAAKDAEAQAVQAVADKTLALSNAQEQQQRTAQQGLDQIRQAQEALAQAGAAGAGGAGGVNAFAAAMAQLAPNARAFVREVIALKPAWDSLRLDVQQRLFTGLAGALAATAATDLPILRHGLDGAAGALNGMAKGVFAAAQSLGKSGVLRTALDGANAGLRNLTRIPGQVVTAFGQVAAAGAPLFQRLTKDLAGHADSLADRISKSFTSGGMAQAIDQAARVLGQIGDVLKNVGSVLGSVFKAADSAGGSWLGILQDITGAMKTAFASPGVQAALGALFSTMRVLGETLGPLVAQALGALAPVLATLGPPAQVLVKALGSALSPIIKALGPVLVAVAKNVGALVTAFAPLLPIVGDLIADLLPVLVPWLQMGAKIFSALAGPVQQIAVALGSALKPVIKGLSDVIGDLVDQYLAVFMDVLGDLLPLIPTLIPVLLQLGTSYGQVLEAVAPLLPQLLTMTALFVTQLLPAILPLIPPLADLATMLLILSTDVITGVVVPTLTGLIDFMHGLQKAFQPAIDAVKWLTTGIAKLFEWLSDHLVGHSVIPDMVRSIVGWFAGLPGKAVAALGNIAARLAGVMVNATNRMIGAVITGLKAIVSWMRDLPGRAKDALGDLGSYLYRSGQALLRGFASGIKSMASHVKNAASSVLSGVSGLFPHSPAKEGPFSGRGYPLYSGQAIGEALGDGMLARAEHVKRAAATMMGAAAGALGVQPGGGFGSLAVARGVGGGFAGGGGTVRHEYVLRVEGSDPLARAIREMVRAKGGGGSNSVQRAFG